MESARLSPSEPICRAWLGGVAGVVSEVVAMAVEALRPVDSTVEDIGVVEEATHHTRSGYYSAWSRNIEREGQHSAAVLGGAGLG